MDTTGTSPAEWHSIRPWAPRLALFVREITSVSATFILSSSLSDTQNNSGQAQSDLASLGLVDESASDSGSDADGDSDGEPESNRELIISNALAKGLSVNVNGSPWQRVLIRIDDKADEAVIIIYGLMPGRQYDIDLGLVKGGGPGQHSGVTSLRRQVVTEDSDRLSSNADDRSSSNFDSSSSAPSSSQPSATTTSTSIATSHLPLPTPPQSPSPSSPSNPHSHLSIEDRTTQLQHNLAQLVAERSSLTTSLKTARRDAQKADSALRSQIDTLKRASEKHGVAEHRARQKVLALQEAVKRAQAHTTEMEELVKEVERELPGLREERVGKERVYEEVLGEAEKARKELETETELGRKRIERGEGELAALGNRLERIGLKKEKLDGEGGGTIPDLEEELREVRREIEMVERGEAAEEFGYDGASLAAGVAEGDGWDSRFSYLPTQRSRHHSQTQQQPLGPIGRPPLAPIQRPTSSHVPTTDTTAGLRSHRNSLDPPFVYHSPTQPHPQPQLQSQVPQRAPSLKSSPAQRIQSNSSSPSPSLSSHAVTTLSSKAPPFEPSRSVSQAVRASFPPSFPLPSGIGPGISILQRPAGAVGPLVGQRKSASNSHSNKWGNVKNGGGSMDSSR